MSTLEYGYEKNLGSMNFDEAINLVKDALQKEGFGVLTEIDIKETMKRKLDLEFRRYKILGACNPVLANRALGSEPNIGLLLPCNVVVQEYEDGAVGVSIADPKAMFKMVKNEELRIVAEEADSRLKRVMKTIG